MTHECSSGILDESQSSEIMFLKPYKGACFGYRSMLVGIAILAHVKLVQKDNNPRDTLGSST